METRNPTWAARLPLCIALGAWALVSCQEDAPGAPEDAGLISDRSLHFAWPVPCNVEVTEEHLKSTQTALLRYVIELRETETPGVRVVRKRDFQFLEVNNLEATSSRLRHMVAPQLVSQGIVPDLFIDTQGQIVGVEEWDSYSERVDQMLKFLVREGSITELHAENTRQMMKDPAVWEGARAGAGEFWVLWVNGWLDIDFNESAQVVIDGEFPLQGGGVLTFPQTLRHNGSEEGRNGYVRLSMESRLDGEEVTRALAATLQIPAAAESVTSAETTNIAWVVLRPETMQPIEAMSENRRIMKTTMGDRETFERRSYKFVWK